jgi:mannosyl-glycoprotein endo-beta-N-acetylglucosaminidase
VPPTEEEMYARVTTASGPLNLRKNASTNSTLLAKIPQNAIIQVLKKLGTWTQVNYNGKEGYVMTTFLTFIENSDTPVTPPSGSDQPSTDTTLMAQVTTQTGSLNLRKNAASNATILTTIPQYSYIQVLSRGDTWSKVTYKSYTGYVKSSFLTFVSTPAAPPSSGQPDDQTETPWARVTTESGSLNLRASASTTARILDTIPRHAIISVLEKGSVWSRVSYDGLTGYVKNSFLTFLHEHPNQGNAGGSTPTVPASPNDMRDATMIELASVQVVKALPAGASATLRVGCSHDADALAVILRGEYVVVSAVGEAWCRIEYEGVQGYLPAEILDI